MGILRSIGITIGKFILTLFLTSLIFTIGLVQFTEYENMKIVFSDIIGSQIGGSMTEEELEKFQNVSSTSFFDEIYYKEYDCNFFECLQTGQFTIIASAQGHNFFNQIQIYLAIGIIVGAIIILILAESWPDRLKGIGWALVFTGISYLFLKFGKGAIATTLPNAEQVDINVMSMIDKMFEPMMNGFLIILIIGIVITASGYALAYKEKRKSEEQK